MTKSNKRTTSPENRHQPMPLVEDLPSDLCEAIGRVVTKFSYLENMVRRIIYDLRDLDTSAGRQEQDLFRKNIGELLDVLFTEVKQRALTVTKSRADLKAASNYEDRRDLFAHAIFVRDQQGQILVRNASLNRKWQPPGGRGKGVKNSVEPSGEIVDAETLLRLAWSIGILSDRLDELWREIAPQLPNSRLGKI